MDKTINSSLLNTAVSDPRVDPGLEGVFLNLLPDQQLYVVRRVLGEDTGGGTVTTGAFMPIFLADSSFSLAFVLQNPYVIISLAAVAAVVIVLLVLWRLHRPRKAWAWIYKKMLRWRGKVFRRWGAEGLGIVGVSLPDDSDPKKEMREALKAALPSSDFMLSQAIYVSLATLNTPEEEIAKTFTEALKNPDAGVRESIAGAFKEFDISDPQVAQEVLNALIGRIMDENEAFNVAAVSAKSLTECLVKFQNAGVEASVRNSTTTPLILAERLVRLESRPGVEREAKEIFIGAMGEVRSSGAEGELKSIIGFDNLSMRVRIAAMKALGKIGECNQVEVNTINDMVNVVIKEGPDSKLVEPAIEALAITGTSLVNKHVQKRLSEVLGEKNTDNWIRARIAKILGKLAVRQVSAGEVTATSTIGILSEALSLQETETVLLGELVNALTEIGQPAINHLLPVLVDGPERAKRGAAQALGKIIASIGQDPDGNTTTALIKAITDPSQIVREAAMEALAIVGRPAFPGLVPLLTQLSSETRQAAAQAMGKVGDPQAVALLERTLSGENNPDVRLAIVKALLDIGQSLREDQNVRAQIITALFRVLSDREPAVYKAAMEAYQKLGATEQQYLTGYLKAFSSESVEVRRDVISRLWQFGRKYPDLRGMTIQVLFLSLSDSDPDIFKEGVEALKVLNIENDTLVAGIIQALETGSIEIRQAALDKLVGLGLRTDAVAEALKDRLEDEDRGMRKSAREAFERLNIRFPYEPETVIRSDLRYLQDRDAVVRINSAKTVLQWSEQREYWRQAVDALVEVALDLEFMGSRSGEDNESIQKNVVSTLNEATEQYHQGEEIYRSFLEVVHDGIEELGAETTRRITHYLLTEQLRRIRDQVYALFTVMDSNGVAILNDTLFAAIKDAYESAAPVDASLIHVIVDNVPDFEGLSPSAQKIVIDCVDNMRLGGDGEAVLPSAPEPAPAGETGRTLPSAASFTSAGGATPSGTRGPPGGPGGPAEPAGIPGGAEDDIERRYSALHGLVSANLKNIDSFNKSLHLIPRTAREFPDEKSKLTSLHGAKVKSIILGILLILFSFAYRHYATLPMPIFYSALVIGAFLIAWAYLQRAIVDMKTLKDRLVEEDRAVFEMQTALDRTNASMSRSYYFDRMGGNSSLLVSLSATADVIRDGEWDADRLSQLSDELGTRAEAVSDNMSQLDINRAGPVSPEVREILMNAINNDFKTYGRALTLSIQNIREYIVQELPELWMWQIVLRLIEDPDRIGGIRVIEDIKNA
ncbi:MAG: HEAT repeat domain-containing protein, partial [Candidatus Omnitrophota bacterium]